MTISTIDIDREAWNRSKSTPAYLTHLCMTAKVDIRVHDIKVFADIG